MSGAARVAACRAREGALRGTRSPGTCCTPSREDMPTSQPLHVVLGTGPVGATLAAQLVHERARVRIVNRSGRRPTGMGVAAELVAGDVADAAFARRACQGASIIYNCTSLDDDLRGDADRMPLHRATVEGAAAAGAVLVVLDDLSVYGPTAGAPLHEGLPFHAQSAHGRARAEAHAFLMDAHASGRVRVTLGRATDYFGPGADDQSPLGREAFERAMQGQRLRVPVRTDLPHSLSFVPDVVQGLRVLGRDERALGAAWHLPVVEPVPVRELVRLIGQEAGTQPAVSATPAAVLRMRGLVARAARPLAERLHEWEQPYVVDSSRFEQTFGVRATPLREAIHRTVEWIRREEEAGRGLSRLLGVAVKS